MIRKEDTGPKPSSKANPKSNRNILGITYVVVALFLGLAAYLGYFLQVKSEEVINNSYNARLDSFSDRIVRGRILASDGTVLALTQTDGEGNETRVYPFGDMFDHAVGYSTKGKTGIEALANFYLLTSHVTMYTPPWIRNSSRRPMPRWGPGRAWSLPWSRIPARYWPWCPNPAMTPTACRGTGML